MLKNLFRKFIEFFAAGLAVVIYIFFVYDDDAVRGKKQ